MTEKKARGARKRAQLEAYASALAQDTEHDDAIAALQELVLPTKKAQPPQKASSPIGKTAAEGAAKRAARSAAYRAAHEKHVESRAIAKEIIHQRTSLGVSRQQLADTVGMSSTQISRLESGRATGRQLTHAWLIGKLAADERLTRAELARVVYWATVRDDATGRILKFDLPVARGELGAKKFHDAAWADFKRAVRAYDRAVVAINKKVWARR